MKRSGFKRLTFEEAKAKQEAARARKAARPATKPAVKHPTIMGVKSRRWTGIKGCLWAIFSDYIRLRDFLKYRKCVSCNHRFEHWRDGDAGHYVSVTRGNFFTLFHEKNVNLQCKRCNNPDWTSDAAIPYRIELDRRWGAGTADEIEALAARRDAKAYSTLEYGRAITHFKEKFDILKAS